jgi:hypothetical protein
LPDRRRQLERNLGIKAEAESLVAELRVRSHDNHRTTGGAVKITRAQSGQKLQRSGMVQIANSRVPNPHSHRLSTACVGWLRDQKRRKPTTMVPAASAIQPLKLHSLLSDACDVEIKLTVADDDCAPCGSLSALEQSRQDAHSDPI